MDLERGIINLNPDGRRQTSKRRARVKIGPALIEVLRALPQDTPRVLMFRGRTLGRMVCVWPKAKARAKLKGRVNAYSLRHTVASYLREMDVPPWEAAHCMGHRMDGHSMTERYTHMSPAYHKNAAAALDDLLRAVLADPLPYEGKQVKFTPERSRAVNDARKASRSKSVPRQELRP